MTDNKSKILDFFELLEQGLQKAEKGEDEYKEFLDKASGAEITNLKTYAKDAPNTSEEELIILMEAPEVIKAVNFFKRSEDAKKLYADLGIPLTSGSKPKSKGEKGDDVDPSEDGEFDIASILKTVGIEGPLAAVIASFMGGSAAKWGLGVGGGKMLLDWLNTPEGQKLVENVKSSLGAGGEQLGGLLSGGLGNLGGAMTTIADTFGDLADNPKLKGMFEGVMGLIKDQPLVAAAVGYSLYQMFGNGLSFGGIFSAMPTALLALGLAFVAEQFLDLKGSSQGRIITDAPSQSPAAFPSFAKGAGVIPT